MLLIVAAVVGVLAGGAAVFVRGAGNDPDEWHVDPMTAPKPPTPNSYRVAPSDAEVPVDAPAPTFDVPASELAARFDAVALGAPRTEVLAGSSVGLHVTYVQRSALWGFPDFVSVRFLDAGSDGGSTLAVFSRSRFGKSDLGVNKKRVTAWLDELASTSG